MRGWYISQRGKVSGPFPFEQLRASADAGQLTASDYVCPEGSSNWIRAGEVANLFSRGPAIPQGILEPSRGSKTNHVNSQKAAVNVAEPHTEMPSRVSAVFAPISFILRLLPKPLLFGLFGGCGGLLGAVLLAEILWAGLSPTAFTGIEPKLQIAVPPAMKIYAGGDNWFTVKIARQGFEGPIRITARADSEGLSVVPVFLEEHNDEADVQVKAAKGMRPGKHRLTISGRGWEAAEGMSADTTLNMSVVPQSEPLLQIAVSPEVGVTQGGKGKFFIKLARAKRGDKVMLEFDGTPRGVIIATKEVPDGQNEVELEALAARDADTGRFKVAVRGTTVDQPEVPVALAEFRLDVAAAAPTPKMDVIFVLDLTGSMDFAIKGIKEGILEFARKMEDKGIDFRVGLVGFRDIEDDRELPFPLTFNGQVFTRDFKVFSDSVAQLKAVGGGDEPESCLQGLLLAGQQKFRDGVDRVLILITDAPPKLHLRPEAKILPYSIADAITALENLRIQQIHMVVRQVDYDSAYKKFHGKIKGSFFDIHKAESQNFASLLPKLGEEISVNTVATAPVAPTVTLPPPLPAAENTAALPRATSVSTLQAVQSTATYSSSDQIRLLLAISVWSMVIGAAISLAILAGQRFYARRHWFQPVDCAKALVGGLLAGAIAGCVGQLLFQVTSGSAAWDAVSKIAGWSLLGAVTGGGLAFFVPNLRLSRGALGGLIGGVLGAICFVVISDVSGLLGRWLGAAILGFCIGLMVALVELAFRRWWLEVSFGPREIRTFTLGSAKVNVGSDARRATVVVADSIPLALRFWVEGDRVVCENKTTDVTREFSAGESQLLGKVKITVCSSSASRSSGYTLKLSTGKQLTLAEGMPLTPDDVPGLAPQGTDGIVALSSRRPNDPNVLVLRNRSRQAWAICDVDGAARSIDPGLGVEIDDGVRINFGVVQGEFIVSNRSQRMPSRQRIT